jgi:hypothetical protein
MTRGVGLARVSSQSPRLVPGTTMEENAGASFVAA